jgi:hypothetical protein
VILLWMAHVQVVNGANGAARDVASRAAGMTEAPPSMTMSSGGAGMRVMVVGSLPQLAL